MNPIIGLLLVLIFVCFVAVVAAAMTAGTGE